MSAEAWLDLALLSFTVAAGSLFFMGCAVVVWWIAAVSGENAGWRARQHVRQQEEERYER